MVKKIEIFFADPSISIDEYFDDIKKAIQHARRNLWSRHKVKLDLINLSENNSVICELTIPASLSKKKFNCGNHLRGISAYLNKTWSEKYRKLMVGERLLCYLEDENSVNRTG